MILLNEGNVILYINRGDPLFIKFLRRKKHEKENIMGKETAFIGSRNWRLAFLSWQAAAARQAADTPAAGVYNG